MVKYNIIGKERCVMTGKLIIVEGLDGSGKTTQVNLLSEKLNERVKFISFPNYDTPSGQIINQYLKGAYAGLEEAEGAYSASSFYAVDRYISFKTDWSRDYNAGVSIISARYTGSNSIYQMAKLPKEEWDAYYKWLCDFEFKKLGLPKPDAVIFLDMPFEVSRRLLEARYSENGGEKDMHEADAAYLKKCGKAAAYAAEKENWIIIKCAKEGNPRGIDDINAELTAIVLEKLKENVK